MRRTSLPIVESYKVEGKLLTNFKTMWIKWNAHKEFPICTFKNILLSLSNWMSHKLEKTLATTMSSQEILQILMHRCKRESPLPKSLMESGMGFWRRSKLGFASIFRSCLLRWIVQDCRPFRFRANFSSFRSSSSYLSPEGPVD
jgi:hypothetical protein